MKRKPTNNLIQLGDLGYEEEIEENGICESPVLGTLINTFSFQDNIPASKESTIKKKTADENETLNGTLPPDALTQLPDPSSSILGNKILQPSQPYGITPPIYKNNPSKAYIPNATKF